MSNSTDLIVKNSSTALRAPVHARLPPVRVPLNGSGYGPIIKNTCDVSIDAQDINVTYSSPTTDFSLNIKWSALKGLFS